MRACVYTGTCMHTFIQIVKKTLKEHVMACGVCGCLSMCLWCVCMCVCARVYVHLCESVCVRLSLSICPSVVCIYVCICVRVCVFLFFFLGTIAGVWGGSRLVGVKARDLKAQILKSPLYSA